MGFVLYDPLHFAIPSFPAYKVKEGDREATNRVKERRGEKMNKINRILLIFQIIGILLSTWVIYHNGKTIYWGASSGWGDSMWNQDVNEVSQFKLTLRHFWDTEPTKHYYYIIRVDEDIYKGDVNPYVIKKGIE